MLIEGGAPRFLADSKNHQIVITGKRFIMPFKRIKFRLWAVSYTVLAKAKRPEDARPWATTRRSAPAQPHWVCVKIPAVTNPIWLTEEYAISALISVWRKHSILAIQAPQRLNTRIGVLHINVAWGKWVDKRKRPYLPSLSKIPARIMEPATGASTCAFGNQRWTE